MSYKFLDLEDAATATEDDLLADLREAEKQLDAAIKVHPGMTYEAEQEHQQHLDVMQAHIDKLHYFLNQLR
jgi:hypothetical protein